MISVGPLRFVPLLLLSLACDRLPLTDFTLMAPERGKGLVQSVLAGRLIDCPDGIARCSGRVVKASRLATVDLPCNRAESTCACPRDVIGICPTGCVSDGLEVAMDRTLAAIHTMCACESGVRFHDRNFDRDRSGDGPRRGIGALQVHRGGSHRLHRAPRRRPLPARLFRGRSLCRRRRVRLPRSRLRHIVFAVTHRQLP